MRSHDKLGTIARAPVAYQRRTKMRRLSEAEGGRRRLPDGAVRADGPAARLLYVRYVRPRPTPPMSVPFAEQAPIVLTSMCYDRLGLSQLRQERQVT